MKSHLKNAFIGSLVADAVAMPVHWYYDTSALDRDYPKLDGYLAPRNPHTDSILWRSQYTPRNARGDILHDQAKFWGQRGIHYHQFLKAGENTVNYQLAAELYRLIIRESAYSPDRWLDRYIECLLTPGWHRDTYLEEYHRAFFDRHARGKKPRDCGIEDIHIGGLATVPALVAAISEIETEPAELESVVRQHIALTHRAKVVDAAGLALVRMLRDIADGATLEDAVTEHATGWLGRKELNQLAELPDRAIIGRHFSPACYLPGSFAASLALAWKYQNDFAGGIIANALCGGDS
ncbi:MAG: ADP-ribosylglycohydrolase family protein, partial [Verrucomicrobiota bacterium]